ncbi:hypothetical protein SELMODRAFT_419973 [Selaginella moellendorffii]|uniref:F-box domain-containing protein n=1 Tax=Selaginella moellendorffii TaxID=88036 RepID=D8SA58_SELML|nr:hypothetical protein SELMODRAFT_419973 [Selaginella moellendorffii]
MANRNWDGMIDKKKSRKLDPSIWSRLPQDIQHRLITFLPFPTLCRFRSLSKDWCAAIQQQPPRQQWYIALGDVYGKFLISPNAISWKEFTLPLPREARIFALSTCSAGLVLSYDSTFARYFVVLNPLQQTRRELGCPMLEGDHEMIFAAIQSAPPSGSWFVVVVTIETSYGVMVFHLYDSRAAAWISSTEFTPVQEDEDLVCGVRMNSINYSNNCMLLQNDHLYFLTVSPGNVRRLKSFNVWNPKATLRTLATWNNLPLGFERQPWYEVDMSLISSGGKIVIGMLETHDRNTDVRTLRVCFVYLDEESCSWRAMASLSLGTVKIPKLIKKPGRIFMVAAGNEHTTEFSKLRCSLGN